MSWEVDLPWLAALTQRLPGTPGQGQPPPCRRQPPATSHRYQLGAAEAGATSVGQGFREAWGFSAHPWGPGVSRSLQSQGKKPRAGNEVRGATWAGHRLRDLSQADQGPSSLTPWVGAELQGAAPLGTAGGAVGAAFTGHLQDAEAQGQAQHLVMSSVQSPTQKLLCGGATPCPGPSHLGSSQLAPSLPLSGH